MDRISNGEKVDELPLMESDFLQPPGTTGATDTVPAPGAGFKLEVHGAVIYDGVNAAFVATGFGSLAFLSSVQHILRVGIAVTPGAIVHSSSGISGIRVLGNENEALTLTNYTFGAGGAYVRAIVFYRIVPV